MNNEAVAYSQAVQFYQQNNLAACEQVLRQVLAANSSHAPSLHLLGIVAYDANQYAPAEELVRDAIDEQPSNPSYYFTLGRILNRQDKKDEAIKSYRKAIELKPGFIDALNNLGTIYISEKKTEEALKCFKEILSVNPDNFNALCNMGSILYGEEKYDEALDVYRHALSLNDQSAMLHYDIGRTLRQLDRPDEAGFSFEAAVKLKPDYVDAFKYLGDIAYQSNKLEEAIQYYSAANAISPEEILLEKISRTYVVAERYDEALYLSLQAVEKFPDSPLLYNNLGFTYHAVGYFSLAVEAFQQSLSLKSDSPGVMANVASSLKSMGRLQEAIDYNNKALAMDPGAAWIYSNQLLTMVYESSVKPEDLTKISSDFDKYIADPLYKENFYTPDLTKGRKLRIGYISPDLRQHAVSYFLAPVWECNKDEFEIFAYAKVEKEDEISAQLKERFDKWHNVYEKSDDYIIGLIHEDKIDILVDLAGHTANNGLTVMARKPAPVQVTWLGYPATTGMKAIDYRITDNYAEPPGMTEKFNVEKLWRLPDIFCTYRGGSNAPQPIDHPPFEDNGYITFGCFNNYTKVTDPAVTTWARILENVPYSRLYMEISGVNAEPYRHEVIARLTRLGIPAERLILEPKKRENQYVLYNKIDIALDPFPCVGGTTSMDTLWMGVPFVTLEGHEFRSRMGVTILENAGLPQFIAKNTDEYVSIVTRLASDPVELKRVRQNLRQRFEASPVMDQKRFARNMEAAYREMWDIWIGAGSSQA